MTDAPSPQPPLPFWPTVLGSYRLFWQRRAAIWQMAWPWLLLTAAIMGAFYWTDWLPSAEAEAGGILWRWQDGFVALVPPLLAAPLAVGCHRLVLLGEIPRGLYLRLDAVVARYALWLGGLTLLSAASFAPFAFAPLLSSDTGEGGAAYSAALAASVVLLALAVVLYTRLSLILPARAVEHEAVTAGEVWRTTGGNFWRLFLGGLLAIIPPMLLGIPLVIVVETNTHQLNYTLVNLAFDVLFLAGGAIGVIFLSLAYRHLFPNRAGAPARHEP